VTHAVNIQNGVLDFKNIDNFCPWYILRKSLEHLARDR